MVTALELALFEAAKTDKGAYKGALGKLLDEHLVEGRSKGAPTARQGAKDLVAGTLKPEDLVKLVV